jgi:hypothetical protein
MKNYNKCESGIFFSWTQMPSTIFWDYITIQLTNLEQGTHVTVTANVFCSPGKLPQIL